MYKQPEREHAYSREDLRKELIAKSLESEKKRKKAKKKSRNNKIIFILIFLIIVALGVLGFILYNKANGGRVGKTPGKVIFDSSVSEDEQAYINERIAKMKSMTKSAEIYSDVTISAETTFEIDDSYNKSNNTDVKIVYDALLPTVDFYDSELNVTQAEAESENGKVKWVSLREITPARRVVSIDSHYFFDEYERGAKFRIMHVKGTDKTDTRLVANVISKFASDAEDDDDDPETAGGIGSYFPFSKDNYLSFAQTGVTALVRAMTITLNDQAGGRGSYFADNIKDFLSEKDLTHISNEASFVNDCKGSTGTMMLCSDWRVLDSITAIGTDIVELTGNHNNNYGTDANIATINKYHELGMKTFGGGVNETEAAKPLVLDEKGINITLLGYNKSSSTRGNGELADGNDPGANEFTEEKARSDIAAAKALGDFIIVDLQFSECYAYPDGYTEMPECDAPISGQQAFFRQFVDWGADIVIGTQAHHPQTFEYYHGKPIYYGLGNFFFDQTYWPGTQRGYILTHYFDVESGKYLNTRISPTWYDKKHQVYLTNEETSESFIKRLMNTSPKGN